MALGQQENRASHAVKYSKTSGHYYAEWQVPCEVIGETKGGMLKVREFRKDGDVIKYVSKIKVIKLN